MRQKLMPLIFFVAAFIACKEKKVYTIPPSLIPLVENNGVVIKFQNQDGLVPFKTEKLSDKDITGVITAPAKIAASVIPSEEGASQNIILFENSDLAGSYMQLIQHQINIRQIEDINIKQKKIELDRIKDLQLHGAATGKDLLEAQTGLAMARTDLANERASLIEHETKLKTGGFDPEQLLHARPGVVYIICDIPENQVSKIRKGRSCNIQFTSFPTQVFTGKIDDLADVVDNTTRMVKLRINLENADNKLKAGMFGLVSFVVDEGDNLSLSKSAIITVQGRNYVFVKKNHVIFERREVKIGQQIGDRIIIYDGLHPNEEVAVEGVIRLKGLSFGY